MTSVPAPHPADVQPTGIAALVAAGRHAGPVLVVADAAAIAAAAPEWAASFAAAGMVHRVVVQGVDLVAAAAGLDARVVVAAGSPATVAAARTAAAALGAPLVDATALTGPR